MHRIAPEVGVAQRGGAEDDSLRAQIHRGLDGFGVANSAAKLELDGVLFADLCDRFDGVLVLHFSAAGAVQVHDVQFAGARVGEAAGGVGGGSVVGGAVVVALG